MARLFRQDGYPSFAACERGSPIEQSLRNEKIECLSLQTKNYVSPNSTWALRQKIIEWRIQAIFLHSLKDVWLVAPALWGLHHLKLFGFARMFLKNVSKKDLGHRLVYSRLDHIIALSEIQKLHLIECLPVPADRFIVIPNGVDCQKFQPRARREDIRSEWHVGANDFLFGLTGRLDRQKGSIEFVDAAQTVFKKHPNARFVLVGGNTHGESDIAAEVRRRLSPWAYGSTTKSPAIVTLSDFRDDVAQVLNAFDAFVMPSYEENFGNVLLEAMASGLPCIGTQSGGTPEMLAQGDAGLLCQPRSTDSLAQAMTALLESSDLRQKLAQAARARALAEYDINKIFRRIQQLVN